MKAQKPDLEKGPKRKPNQDVFSALLDASFEVPLASVDVPLTCRELPFSTLMRVITIIATSTRDEIVSARQDLAGELIDLASGYTADPSSRDADSRVRQVQHMLGLLTPMLSSLVVQIPEIMNCVLLDVVLDADEHVIRRFSAADVLSIIEATLDRLDTGFVAEKLSSVFSEAVALLKMFPQAQQKSVPKLPPQTSSSTSST